MCILILYLISYILSYTCLMCYIIIFKSEKIKHFGEIKQGPIVLYGYDVPILQMC